MERTSIITVLLLADAADYDQLTLVNGLPDAQSMIDHFSAADLVLEKSRLKETTADSDHGQLVSHEISAAIYRDSTFHEGYVHKEVLAYVETANGEKYLLGSPDYPLSYNYDRNSGESAADIRDTRLIMGVTQPV